MHSIRTLIAVSIFLGSTISVLIPASMSSDIAANVHVLSNMTYNKITAQAYGGQSISNLDVAAQEKTENSDDDKYEIYRQAKGMDKSYTGTLPWENDPAFLEAINKNNTPIVMAAYKATLPDPIQAEAYNIGLAAEQLAGTVVQPGEIFSQNKVLGPYSEHKGYRAGPTYAGNKLVTTVGGGVCKIASVLYNVTTLSDLKVILRSCHSMTVPYVPPGQDATVYYGVKDFSFINNSGGPILIWSKKVDASLYMAIYGQKIPPQVTWHHEVKKKLKYWTLYRSNPNLPPDTEKVIMPGQDGYVVRSWVTVKRLDGTIETKEKGMSWYNASPRIIERGPKT